MTRGKPLTENKPKMKRGKPPIPKKKKVGGTPSTKQRGLTVKEQAFCIEYCSNGGNATKAAIKAGYSEHTAASIGSQNLIKLHIKAEVERLSVSIEVLVAEMGITKMAVMQKHWEMLDTSIAHLHNTWIERTKFEELTNKQKACIQEIDTKVITRNIGSYEEPDLVYVEHIKVKLYSRVENLKEISKLMGYNATIKTDLDVKVEQVELNIIEYVSD